MSKMKKAMEKAKEERQNGGYPAGALRNFSTKFKSAPLKRAFLDRREVQVDYSRTRVQQIDPKTLKKNRVIAYFQDNPMTQQINMLRTQVLEKLQETSGNCLMVTSANSGEGKTFTAINLGISIAYEIDRTVLLVDADLKEPAIHHYDFSSDFFGIDLDQGISDYLTGRADIPDIILNPGIKKLTLLPGGRPLENSAELLGSPRMEALIHEMKTRYPADRVIIFDSPAVLNFSDPVVLSRFMDGIIFVVEEERTSGDEVRQALSYLKNRPVMGMVLNKARSN